MTPTLKLLTWPDYHSPESLRAFEKEFGTSLELEIAESANEIVARMRALEAAPDLLCHPDYAVRQASRPLPA